MTDLNWIEIIGGIDPSIVENVEHSLAACDSLTPENSETPRRVRRTYPAAKTFIRAAIIALAFAILAGGLLLLDENVRAGVLRAFVKQEDNGVRVSFGDLDKSGDKKDVRDVGIGYIPDGLTATEKPLDYMPGVRYVILQTESGREDIFAPYVEIKIGRSGELEPGYGNKTYENLVYESTFNGMQAYRLDFSAPINEKPFEIHSIVFGDGDITVSVLGQSISVEEVEKIAENITW